MMTSIRNGASVSLFAFACALAVDPWPGETWGASTNLTSLNSSGWTSNLSGAYWNPVTRRLWVANNSGNYSRLRENGSGSFAMDTTFSPGGDFEAITQADPSSNRIYLLVEGTQLLREYNATTGALNRTWNLSSLMTGVPDANDAVEGIAFIPDAWLAARGFRDANGNLYPQSAHGANGLGGIMLVSVQDQTRTTAGFVYAVDLKTDNTWTLVGSYKTSREESCELSFDPVTGRLYILHNIDGNILEVTDLTSAAWGSYRKFTTLREIQVPSSSNIEGFAVTPALKPDGSLGDRWAFFTDDANAQGALRWFKQLPSSLAVSAGNGQTAPATTDVPVRPAALARDAFGNGIPGYPVTFQVASGGGAVAGGSAVTDSLGVARPASWTLGAASGTNTLSATATGLTGSPLAFTATATGGSAVLPGRSSTSMELDTRLGRVYLVARKAGIYQVSRFDGAGRLLSGQALRLTPGRHELASGVATATFVEARFGDETIVLAVGKQGK